MPELPFTCDSDGIVYEPEAWELARQQRLERYARQRDQIAGIVIYDGECDEAADTLVQQEVWPQATTENQVEVLHDEQLIRELVRLHSPLLRRQIRPMSAVLLIRHAKRAYDWTADLNPILIES